MLGRYYSPLIRRQLSVYLGFTFICALLMSIPFPERVRGAIFTLIWGAIPYLVYLAPCALGKFRYSQTTDRLLPATALEKLTIFSLYFLVAVPLSVYLLPIMAEYLCLTFSPLQSEVIERLTVIQRNSGYIVMLINVLSGIGSIMACLYVVNRVRTGKVMWGVITVFAIQFVEGILGAIIGFSAVFKRGVEDGWNGTPMSDSELTDFTLQILQPSAGTWTIVAILVIFAVAVFVANYRWLRYKR